MPVSTDDILAAIDDAIDDTEGYIEWHGSADSATWAADGSHEPDELDGDYYAYDRPRLQAEHGWVRAPEALLERCIRRNQPRLGFELTPLSNVVVSHPRRNGRTLNRVAFDEDRRTLEELTGPRVPMLEQMHAGSERARVRLHSWQEHLLEQLRPDMEQMAAALAAEAARVASVVEAVDEQLHPTVTGDDRRPRPRRTGRDAQTSPYPAGRRHR